MTRVDDWLAELRETWSLAVIALRGWTPRQFGLAAVVSTVVALVLGMATVLIPNPIFGREIPPVWWNYPVWILTSVLTGMLVVTYIRPPSGRGEDETTAESAEERRTSRLGMAGGVLAWFAVGCPVCNKIALLALGYTGALTWFAPLQPILALTALVLSAVALLWRLRGQVVCPAPQSQKELVR